MSDGPLKLRPQLSSPAMSYTLIFSSSVNVLVVVVVVIVVDLYSASRSASNALNVPLRRKKMSFQRRFETVGTPSRVPEAYLYFLPVWDDYSPEAGLMQINELKFSLYGGAITALTVVPTFLPVAADDAAAAWS